MDNNTESQVTEAPLSQDAIFDKAFSELADAFENPSDHVEDTTDSTTGTNQAATNEEPKGIEQLQQSEVILSAENTAITPDPVSSKADEAPAINYKDMYEQLQQTYNAQTGLLHSRINDLSDKYQNLKQATATEASTPLKDESMEALEEFKEIYPDVYKAVEILLKKQSEDTVKSVESMVSQSVTPIRQHIEHSTQQSYTQRVAAEHPDVFNIISSGALRQWADKLDPVRQAGAHMIMSAGSADQVIQLIHDYKKSAQPGSAPAQPQQQTTVPQTTLTSQEEEIAKRVAQLIGVSSKTPGMSVMSNENKPAVTEDYDTVLMNHMKEWTKRNRK